LFAIVASMLLVWYPQSS